MDEELYLYILIIYSHISNLNLQTCKEQVCKEQVYTWYSKCVKGCNIFWKLIITWEYNNKMVFVPQIMEITETNITTISRYHIATKASGCEMT